MTDKKEKKDKKTEHKATSKKTVKKSVKKVVEKNTIPDTQYRYYGFGNYYMSSLQQGLQAGHVIGELFANHEYGSDKYAQVLEWAKNHKTMVLLKGGNSKDLQELYDFFSAQEKEGMPYAFMKFHEDEASLGGALTYVGMILPNDVYDVAAQLRCREVTIDMLRDALPEWKVNLIERLNWYGLAS